MDTDSPSASVSREASRQEPAPPAVTGGGPWSPGKTLAYSALLVLLLLIIIAFVWYHFTGWVPFSFVGVPFSYGAECGGACGVKSALHCVSGTPCCIRMPDGSCGEVTYCSSDMDCSGNGPHTACAGGVCVDVPPPSWTAKNGRLVDRLRFKNCVFAVDGEGSKNVTAILNSMAGAYEGSLTAPPATLALDRPLNAYSFYMEHLHGLSPDDAAALAAKKVTLRGRYRTI